MTEWVGVALGVIATMVSTWLLIADARRSRAQERLHERLDSNDSATREQESRIATLEEHVKHLPTAESIGRLHEKVNEVGMRVAEIKGGQATLIDVIARRIIFPDKQA